jgi:glycosyltransferase involved in cell wall biosynthesis
MASTSFSDGGVSIVVPVYKSFSTIPQLVARIHTAMLSVTEHEIILVDDSSPDASWEAITEISRSDNRVRGVRFGRTLVSMQLYLLAFVLRSTQ